MSFASDLQDFRPSSDRRLEVNAIDTEPHNGLLATIDGIREACLAGGVPTETIETWTEGARRLLPLLVTVTNVPTLGQRLRSLDPRGAFNATTTYLDWLNTLNEELPQAYETDINARTERYPGLFAAVDIMRDVSLETGEESTTVEEWEIGAETLVHVLITLAEAEEMQRV